MVRFPRLSPIVGGVIDRPSFSFGNHLLDQRGGRTEIHDWIDSVFAEFREFELRLLMGRLSSVLAGTLSKGPRPRRKPPGMTPTVAPKMPHRAKRCTGKNRSTASGSPARLSTRTLQPLTFSRNRNRLFSAALYGSLRTIQAWARP